MKNLMKRSALSRSLRMGTVFVSGVFLTGAAYGQGGRGGGGGWTTSRGDAQRDAWVRTDSDISVENMQKPGFGLQWKTKVGHTAGETISEGVSTNTAQLDPQPGNVAGSGNNLYGYEIDTGYITWTRHFNAPGGPARTAACPGGMTAGVTRETSLSEVINGASPGRAGGGRGAARGGVGAPGEGVPQALLAGRGGGFGGSGGRGGRGGSGRGGAAGFSGFGGGGGGGLRGAPAAAYALASDGVLYAIGEAQGKELRKPIPFLGANANATDLILVGETMYAATINNCGGVASGVWSVDTSTGAVASWKSGANPVGIAFSPDGTLFVSIGDGTAGANGYSDAIVALDPKTLTVKDSFTMPGASFSTPPVIYSQADHEMVAAATKDGRVFLLDRASLKTPVATSAATTTSKTWAPNALASWEDASHTRWILLPASGSATGIVAFKVTGDTKPTLQQAWTANVASPSAPVVVNGVVFAKNDGSATAPAVLYAIDGATGKELWNSGKTITASSKTNLWSISGQVYVATSDANIYAFGTSQGRSPGE